MGGAVRQRQGSEISKARSAAETLLACCAQGSMSCPETLQPSEIGRSLAQVQSAESSVFAGVERILAKWVEVGNCTAGVPGFVLIACPVAKSSVKK
jgi:hypothetical protein